MNVFRPFLDVLAPFGFAARATLSMLHASPLEVFALWVRMMRSCFPVVTAVAFFSSAMLTVQASAVLTSLGASSLSGILVGLGGVRDVFPLLAAGAVAAQSGAAFAGEIGTMRVTEQISALGLMGLDPMRMLVAPRIWASLLSAPLLVIIADGMGLLGAYLVGTYQLGFDSGTVRHNLFAALTPLDFNIGLVRGLVLGWLLAAISCYEGFICTGGTQGVGRATNRAVVRAMISVALANLVITALYYSMTRS